VQVAQDQPLLDLLHAVGFDQTAIDLMHEIDRVFTKYPFFGSRQIAAYLPQSGFSTGCHRVASWA
jgi:putative transposase